jgi:hypothetical protein
MRAITQNLDNTELTIDQLVNITGEITKINKDIEISHSLFKLTDVSLPDLYVDNRQGMESTNTTFNMPAVAQAVPSLMAGESPSPAQPHLDNRLVNNISLSNTLSYYRTIGKPTSILSGISPCVSTKGYLHAALSGIDGVIYIIDHGGKTVLRISDQGQHLSSFCCDAQQASSNVFMRGVAVSLSGKVAVTVDHCVIFSVVMAHFLVKLANMALVVATLMKHTALAMAKTMNSS